MDAKEAARAELRAEREAGLWREDADADGENLRAAHQERRFGGSDDELVD